MPRFHVLEKTILFRKNRGSVLDDERPADSMFGNLHCIDDPLREVSRIRRIGKNYIKKETRLCSALEIPKGVAGAHLRTIETEPAPFEVLTERPENRMILLHEYGPGSTPAQSLDPDGSRARKKVQEDGAFNVGSESLE